jgi:hypothetical protein
MSGPPYDSRNIIIICRQIKTEVLVEYYCSMPEKSRENGS